MKLLILNGPNLNLQGRRDKSVYGAESFEEFIPRLRALYSAHTIDYAQSNIEGELINTLHKAEGEYETEEGCLSLLGGPRKCKRYQKIKVRWDNEGFQKRVKTFTGWTAQIIQHEVDHCNGILI